MTDAIKTGLTELNPAFDLNITKSVHRRKGITVWMTWNMQTGRPCMVLTKMDILLSHERAIPCVVTLETAYLWDEERGDLMHCNLMAALFCDNLGLSRHNVHNVLLVQDTIREFLGDLIAMPPLPRYALRPVADMLVTDNNTGQETVKEIIDHA